MILAYKIPFPFSQGGTNVPFVCQKFPVGAKPISLTLTFPLVLSFFPHYITGFTWEHFINKLLKQNPFLRLCFKGIQPKIGEKYCQLIRIGAVRVWQKIEQTWVQFGNVDVLFSGIEGNILNLIKRIYKKATANIILNSERLNAFLLRSRTWYQLSPLLVNILLEVLIDRAIRKEKEMH